jgi:lysyl-tRNA synthetase class 2
VLEVETPLLARATVTDLHLHSIPCRPEVAATPGRPDAELYLQTSPEFAMKRLLAAGSGPIYQLAKAFRDGESGRLHNPEFTLLEWYRPGFDHHALMDEVEELLTHVLGTPAAERRSYAELFGHHLGLDPHRASAGELRRAAGEQGIEVVGMDDDDRDGWLHLLMTHRVEPHLGRERPTFVVDYPATQAALARIHPGDPPVAERFEVYVEGIELANGFHELRDPAEQRRRFEADLAERRRAGLPTVPIDEHLLAALQAGLPDCAGVALGVDRLVMLAVGAGSVEEVLAFPLARV